MPLSRPHTREVALRCESGDDGSTEKAGRKPEYTKKKSKLKSIRTFSRQSYWNGAEVFLDRKSAMNISNFDSGFKGCPITFGLQKTTAQTLHFCVLERYYFSVGKADLLSPISLSARYLIWCISLEMVWRKVWKLRPCLRLLPWLTSLSLFGTNEKSEKVCWYFQLCNKLPQSSYAPP